MTDPDKKLKTKINNLLFEDEIEGETARILTHYPLTKPMRNWLEILVSRQGTKNRPQPQNPKPQK